MSFKCKIFYALSAFQSPSALQSRTQISSNSISPIPSKPIPITPFFPVPVGTTSSPSTTTHSKQPTHSSIHSVNQKKKKTIRILGSCNGLLALKNDNDRISQWNPSTRKSQVLPSTEIDFSCPSICFDRSTVYGFRYDPISDDYKLVRMVQLLGENDDYFHSEAKVYSLRRNCWRRIKDFCFYPIDKKIGFLANNALHWMVSNAYRPLRLVGFDLGSEEFRCVELLDFRLHCIFWCEIKTLEGYICLTAIYYRLVDVWIMKIYGVKESWIKLISLNEPNFYLWLFSKNGDKVLFSVASHKFAWYDLGCKRVEG
ncbi:F-box protein CPR30-like [Gossypium australe]|uniref:F-box protein CPR30-like n=1 Tax=Gossypium australe TaxID=47621 RepID=A0A5B6VR70_9ROSI|nr:F-box protein CPR30-like [Gossypium australe]